MTQASAPTLGRARVGSGCVGAAESYISLHSPEAPYLPHGVPVPIVIDHPDALRRPAEVTDLASHPKPKHALTLTTPTWFRHDPQWWQVEAAVRSCFGTTKSGIGQFCILEIRDADTYVQTAFCPEAGSAWRLEWRVTEPDGTYSHYYASDPADGGDADILLDVDSVILAFRAFYVGGDLPEALIWRIHPI